MSFERPERLLTKEEWQTIADAAFEHAALTYSQGCRQWKQGEEGSLDRRLGMILMRRSDKVTQTLIKIEDEYYGDHPDEDPDKEDFNETQA